MAALKIGASDSAPMAPLMRSTPQRKEVSEEIFAVFKDIPFGGGTKWDSRKVYKYEESNFIADSL